MIGPTPPSATGSPLPAACAAASPLKEPITPRTAPRTANPHPGPLPPSGEGAGGLHAHRPPMQRFPQRRGVIQGAPWMRHDEQHTTSNEHGQRACERKWSGMGVPFHPWGRGRQRRATKNLAHFCSFVLISPLTTQPRVGQNTCRSASGHPSSRKVSHCAPLSATALLNELGKPRRRRASQREPS